MTHTLERGARRSRRRAPPQHLLLLATALATLGRPDPARAVPDPTCDVAPVVERSSSVEYVLPHGFIRWGSDSVWVTSHRLARGVEYTLDRTRGILRLLREPVQGETLWVASCWLVDVPPLELQLQAYRPARASPESLADSSALSGMAPPRPTTARSPTNAPSGTSLSLAGNKTIAVEFGSQQDAFLKQSLDLTVSGTLAPDVELTGVLSDRNTPLTTAGATQDLRSLDRLLIELKAPQGGASLGDVPLSIAQGEFGRLDRRVQGVRGTWSTGRVQGEVAAASAQGEYRRMEFLGVEGRQGPYLLTDRDGASGTPVVAGSEIVTVDGERLTRGEGADYSIDYDQGSLTFTNRRPIGSSSRITVDYQFAVNRYRRNLAAGTAQWRGSGWSAFTTLLTETDDRGRPVGSALDVSDRLVLASVGDSTQLALGAGVTGGRGDYDLNDSAFVFVGPDSGHYVVQFAHVGPGRGDYAESGTVSGKVTYRYVGRGQGEFAIGRRLPMPDSHQLWSVGGEARHGPLTLMVDGALSRLDRNTFSIEDDGDNLGRAGSAALRLEGGVPSWLGRTAGLEVRGRTVERRFEPFTRLERPYAGEDWGLPASGDLEHQTRGELTAFLRPEQGELSASLARLSTPDGFRSERRMAEWHGTGVVTTRALWERADGEQRGMTFPGGGRERTIGELGVRLPWLEPHLRAEWDERRTPSDTGLVAGRSRELGGLLRSPQRLAWQAQLGYTVRHEALGAAGGFADRSEARTATASLETPAAAPLGASLNLRRRVHEPTVGATTRGDLGSVLLRGADARHGLASTIHVEITSEAENDRTRTLTFVGAGNGAYDSLGNFVGTGDHDLAIVIGDTFHRVARTASSARLAWQFGRSDAWRGSRVSFDFEGEVRRRGELRGRDVAVSPGAARGDPALSRGAVNQRLEADLAPGSPAAALRLRLERRVQADRTFENFTQSTEDRWRTRIGPALSNEVEGRWRRQEAAQSIESSSAYHRALLEAGVSSQLGFAPDARRRVAVAAEAAWQRDEGAPASDPATRTIRVGPELGLGIGARGHTELSARRSFVSGPPALSLLPSSDPAGAPRWEGTARFDYRVHETTTLALSWTLLDRPGRATQTNGRVELRAFF